MKLRDLRRKHREAPAVEPSELRRLPVDELDDSKSPKELVDGFIDLVDIEAELEKRGVDPDSVVSITIDKPELGAGRLDVELEDGAVLKLSKGVKVEVAPAKPAKVSIVMTGEVARGPSRTMREIYAAEEMMRTLEKLTR